ncbi:MAG: type II toxin-antitoxin system Phd/YefM family antitoxin [Mycobacterium sp.]
MAPSQPTGRSKVAEQAVDARGVGHDVGGQFTRRNQSPPAEVGARVGAQHERITVTVHGKPAAVLLAVDDLESLEETIAVLSDSVAVRALGEAEAELARGEGKDEAGLAAAMRARRAQS